MADAFAYGAVIPESDDAPQPEVQPIAELIARLADVDRERPIEAVDIMLTKSPARSWTRAGSNRHRAVTTVPGQ